MSEDRDTFEGMDFAHERRKALWSAKIILEFIDDTGDRPRMFRRQIRRANAYIALAEAFREGTL